MPESSTKNHWKGPTVREIAKLAGVGSASVDRVLNDRPGVKEKTRAKVLTALEKLEYDRGRNMQGLDIRLFCESGVAFNQQMEAAVINANRTLPGVQVHGRLVTTSESDPVQFANQIEKDSKNADGVILIAREHPAINMAMRKLVSALMPVVCLTTDLPSSRRSAYVGNDQYAAGSVAAQLIGQILPDRPNNILLVMSEPFRCQQEREMGFRRVLRNEFPHLRIEERVISNDDSETTHKQLLTYLESREHPAAIYNVAGANRGVAMALEEKGAARKTIFVGHELTPYSRALLSTGVMDYVISHDFTVELSTAVEWIRSKLNGHVGDPAHSQILVHTRYNCGL
ncbi:MAG: LacI family DNA-binding transcriptional regulator [Roseicyclus sp.]|nr:LacI family DNA-binding transcriptional regulator [Roseicyclus sp.]